MKTIAIIESLGIFAAISFYYICVLKESDGS